jgi:hypothetical protein
MGCGAGCTNAQQLLLQASAAFSVLYPNPGGTNHVYTQTSFTCPASFNATYSLANWGTCPGATDTWTFTE